MFSLINALFSSTILINKHINYRWELVLHADTIKKSCNVQSPTTKITKFL